MSRASSAGDCRKERRPGENGSAAAPAGPPAREGGAAPDLFHVIQQLAAAENALWNILDGLKSSTSHPSFFCREYWGSSGSQAMLSLEKLNFNERLKRQVQQACVLESLSLTVASHLCSGVMQGISVTIRSRLRNMLYYIHENCLILLDMVCQKWITEHQGSWQEPSTSGHCPENLNIDILVRVKRYRRLRRGEHVMALRQHNEMIVNVVRQLCRGAAPKRPMLSSRGSNSPGDRSPGSASGTSGQQTSGLTAVNDVLTARMPLDRLRASTIRSRMLQHLCFKPLLNVDGLDPDCPWPTEDTYKRYGAESFAQDGTIIWFEPLPPMLPNLEQRPTLPPVASSDMYTLVLDLDETLVHYSEHNGMGNYEIRPGMHEFLDRMNELGYELVIFTAATQDYADWVIDQIDPGGRIKYRLYRQHALPWGPIFVKDMSRIGRDLDRCLMIDNVQENFMLQPHNGIFILTWYEDPQDTALFDLVPLLEELITTRVKVPEILDKYHDQIPRWAGFEQGGEYSDEDAGDFGSPPHEAYGGYPGTELPLRGGAQQAPAMQAPSEPSHVLDDGPSSQSAAMSLRPCGAAEAAAAASLYSGRYQPAAPTAMYAPQAQAQQYQQQQPQAQRPQQPQQAQQQPSQPQHRPQHQPHQQPQQQPQQLQPQQRPQQQSQQQLPQHQPQQQLHQQQQQQQPQQGGYPQPQVHLGQSTARQQPSRVTPAAAQQASLTPPHPTAPPQGAPQQPLQAPQAGRPAPAFAQGISGPYQAPAPTAAPMPGSAVAAPPWGRAGAGVSGPFQAARR